MLSPTTPILPTQPFQPGGLNQHGESADVVLSFPTETPAPFVLYRPLVALQAVNRASTY